MSDATAQAATSNRVPPSGTTIRPEEAEHFGRLAKDWWDPNGSSAMLHKLNPVRLRFIRESIDLRWGGEIDDWQPLKGKSALDVGCGAGLLCEPLARLGADITGVDASLENIAAAMAHAEGGGLEIDYRAGELGTLGLGQFDLVTCLEVIEHVSDKAEFLKQLAARLKPNGLMILSTPNRTVKSRALMVGAAEAIGIVPKGTHHWEDFITPEELAELCEEAGLALDRQSGIAFSPMKGLHLSDDMSLNYIATARRA